MAAKWTRTNGECVYLMVARIFYFRDQKPGNSWVFFYEISNT